MSVLVYLTLCLLHVTTAEDYVIGDTCLCTGYTPVYLRTKPDEDSPVIDQLSTRTCYKTDPDKHDVQNNTTWYTVQLDTVTGYVVSGDIELRRCDSDRYGHADTMSRGIYGRASTIGDVSTCGPSLQHWATMAPGRVLAQRENRCYGIQTGFRQTYQYAFSYCQSSVSYLVDIQNDQEQAFIEMVVNRFLSGEQVWIGLHDMQREQHFEWTSGKPVSYLNWYSTSQAYSSGNHDAEDCVVIAPFRGGKWVTEACYTGNDSTEPKHLFICEFEIKTPAQMNVFG